MRHCPDNWSPRWPEITCKLETAGPHRINHPDALVWLRQLPRESFDAVVTSLGVNDVTANRHPALVARQVAIDRVAASGIRRGAGAGIRAAADAPGFPALPQPLRWYLGARARLQLASCKPWLASCPMPAEAVEAPAVRRATDRQ